MSRNTAIVLVDGQDGLAMGDTREFVNQINWLIDRQVDAVQGRLSLDDAMEYMERARRIDELLEPLTLERNKLN